MSLVSYIEYLRNGLKELLLSDSCIHFLGEETADNHGKAIKDSKGYLWSF